ncbi:MULTISPECIES: YjhX family toxin [Rhodospirillales]|uniref:UPF0386 protein RC1_1783 n=2 Tax=Rhodospirillales TaxID=204441 RepID=Y1783_RHOCS|nr:YjhX family toxin [Rhodospirillum centenum]B6ITG2.1 RecName: Full=UPF0386 protein RC1_1783 [Rhodospirillum centenum SW]ACI99180.1 conserved hypothetical protein [Rhodospirillum centenum SW]
MNISKPEQRTLHALARGGRIDIEKDDDRRIIEVDCITREGWRLLDCDMTTFRKLRSKRLIASENGGPYRITRKGLAAVRPQPDNRS